MSNYTESETSYMVETYKETPTAETVEMLVEQLKRSKKSIIGKLSREGVYRSEVYVSKTGEKPITKIEIVSNIADALEIEVGSLSGLEKSPKKLSDDFTSGSGVVKMRRTSHYAVVALCINYVHSDAMGDQI